MRGLVACSLLSTGLLTMFNGYHETPSTSYNDLELERGKKNQNCSKWPYGNGNVMQWTHLHSQNHHQTEVWPPKTTFLGIPNAVNSSSKCSCSGCFQMPENQNCQGDLPWHASWFSRSLPVPLNTSHDQVKLQGNYHWENASLLNEASQYGVESVGAQYTQENGDKSFLYKPYAQARLSEIYQSGMMQSMKSCKKDDFIKQEGIMSNAASPDVIQHGLNIARANSSACNAIYEPLRGALDRKRVEEVSDCFSHNEKILNMESCRQPNGPSSYHLHSNNARHAIPGAFLKSVPSNVNQNRVPSVGNRRIKENLFHSVNEVGKIAPYNVNQAVAEEKQCMSLYQVEITKEPNALQDNMRGGHINPFPSIPDNYHTLNISRDLSSSLSEKDTQKSMNGRNPQYFTKNNFSDLMKNNGQNLMFDPRKEYSFGGRKCEMNPLNVNSSKTIHTPHKSTEYGNSKSPDFKKYIAKDCTIPDKSSIPDIKIVINPYAKESVDLQSGNGTLGDEIVGVNAHNNVRRSQFESNDALSPDKGYAIMQRNLNPFKDYRRPEQSYAHRGAQGPYEYLNGMINLSRNDIPVTVNQNGAANIQHPEYRNGLDAYPRLDYSHTYDGAYNQFEKVHYQVSTESAPQAIPSSPVGFPFQSSQGSCAKLDKLRSTEKASHFSDKISHLESISQEKVCKNGTTKISPLRLLRKKKFIQKTENAAEASASGAASTPKNVTPPLDVRRFWATWAEEEEENVSQTQMVVLDCRNIDPEQAGLLHLYEAESLRGVHEDGADALGFKIQTLDKNIYEQDDAVYVRGEVDRVNIDKGRDHHIKTSDFMKIDKICGNSDKGYHSTVENSLSDFKRFESVTDKNHVKSMSKSEYSMGTSANVYSVKETDSVVKVQLGSAKEEGSPCIPKDVETNHVKKHGRESEMNERKRKNFTEKNEIKLEKCQFSSKARSGNKPLFGGFKNDNCESWSDVAKGENNNGKNVFHGNLTKTETTRILSNCEANIENCTNYKLKTNRESPASCNSSVDSESNSMPVLPDLPTSEYRKNKFLEYYDSNFCNSSSSPLINENLVSNPCPSGSTSTNQESNDVEDPLRERDTKVDGAHQLFGNIGEDTMKTAISKGEFDDEGIDRGGNEMGLKMSDVSNGGMEVSEVMRKLSEISFQTANDNSRISENPEVGHSVPVEKYKTEKKELTYKKQRKSKKLHHREKSSRTDEPTFENLSPERPSVQFSIRKSHDLKISFRVLSNAKAAREEGNPSDCEGDRDGEDVECGGSNRMDANERRKLFAAKAKDLAECNERETDGKEDRDVVRRKKKEVKKRKTQFDRLSTSKNPFLKVKRSRYVAAEDCGEAAGTRESFDGASIDLWKNSGHDCVSSEGFQVRETVDSAKIKLTFKRHKKSAESRASCCSPDEEMTEAESESVYDSIVTCFGPGMIDESKENAKDFVEDEDVDVDEADPNAENVGSVRTFSDDSRIENRGLSNSGGDSGEDRAQKGEGCEDRKRITPSPSHVTEEHGSGDSMQTPAFSMQKREGDIVESANVDVSPASVDKALSPAVAANFDESCLKANEAAATLDSYTESEDGKRVSDEMRKEEKDEQSNANDENSNFCDFINKSNFSGAKIGVKFLSENFTCDNPEVEAGNAIIDNLDSEIIGKEEKNYTGKTVLNEVGEEKQITFKKLDDLIEDEKMEIEANSEMDKIKKIIKSTNNEVLCVLENNNRSLIANSDCNSIYDVQAEELTSAGSYSQNENPREKAPEENVTKSDFREFDLDIKSSPPQTESNVNERQAIESEAFDGGGDTFTECTASESENANCINYLEPDTVYGASEEKCVNNVEDVKFTMFNCDYDTFSCESPSEDVEKSEVDGSVDELAAEAMNRDILFDDKRGGFEYNVVESCVPSKRDGESCSGESDKKSICNSVQIQEMIVETFATKISNGEPIAELKNDGYDRSAMEKNESEIHEDHADEKTELVLSAEPKKCANESKNNCVLDNNEFVDGLITENIDSNKDVPHSNFAVEKFAKFSELIDEKKLVESNIKNFENIQNTSEETENALNSSTPNKNIGAAHVEKIVPGANAEFHACATSKEMIAYTEYNFLFSKNFHSSAEEQASVDEKPDAATEKRSLPKSETKILRRYSYENIIGPKQEAGITEQKHIFPSTRSRSKSLNLDLFIPSALDKRQVENSETEEMIQLDIPVCDIPLPPGDPPLENCFDLETYLRKRFANEKTSDGGDGGDARRDPEISPLPQVLECRIQKSHKERLLATAKTSKSEDCRSPFLNSGSVKYRNPSPPCEATTIIGVAKKESSSLGTESAGKSSLRNPSPPFDGDRFRSIDAASIAESAEEKRKIGAGELSAAGFSPLLPRDGIESAPEASKTGNLHRFAADAAEKTQSPKEEFATDKSDDPCVKCFSMGAARENRFSGEEESQGVRKVIESAGEEESQASFARALDANKQPDSGVECENGSSNKFAADADATEDLNFADYCEMSREMMNIKENEAIMEEESIFKADQFYECEKQALYESLAITDDIEVERVSDDDKFLNVMQNCLENAKKFLNIGNLKPFSYSVDDLLEIDYRAAAETCPAEATELENSNHVSKDVMLSSFDGNPNEELIVEDGVQPVEISLDVVPSFCSDAESNLCSEILPVNNWPYLEEEVSSSPMMNIADETDLLGSCLESDLPAENARKESPESENIRRSCSANKRNAFCPSVQDSQLCGGRKSRRVSLSVAEGSAFLREEQQREKVGLSVNGHSKFVLQRRRTVEGLLDGKKVHSKAVDANESDEKVPNASSKDFGKLSFLLKDLKCRLDIERLSLKKDVINDSKLAKRSVRLDVFHTELGGEKARSAAKGSAAKEKQKTVDAGDAITCNSHKTKRIGNDDEETADKKKMKTWTNYKSSAWQPKVVLFRISKNAIKTFSMRPRVKSDRSPQEIDSRRSSEDFQDRGGFGRSPKSSRCAAEKKSASERVENLPGRRESENFGDSKKTSQCAKKLTSLDKSVDGFSKTAIESTHSKKRKKQRFRNLHPKKKLVPEAFNKTKENRLAAQNSANYSSKPVSSESDSDCSSPEVNLPEDPPKEMFHSHLKNTKLNCSVNRVLKQPSTRGDAANSVEHLGSGRQFREHQTRSGDDIKPKIVSKCSDGSDKKKECGNYDNNYYNHANNFNRNHNNKESDRHADSHGSTLKNSVPHKKRECSDGRKELRKESKRKRHEEESNREGDSCRKERNHAKDGERRLSSVENRTGQSDTRKPSREASDRCQSDKHKCKEWKSPGATAAESGGGSSSSSSSSRDSKSKRDSIKERFWVCEVCGFSKSSERIIHIQSHPFHCQSCHLAFKTESNFLGHLTRKHKDIRNQHHCLLCELSFDLEKEYHQHLQTREHRHLESVEKNTINTLFTLLTGHPCPVLGPVESKSEWLPSQAGTVHFYHQATPLSLALQYLKLHHDKGTFSNPTLTPQSE